MTDKKLDSKIKAKIRKGKQTIERMKGKQKKAIIFDMDGVLVDSEPIYQQMFRQFLMENNCTIDETVFRRIAGASSTGTWDIMAQLWYEDICGETLHKEFRRQHPDFQIPYREALFPGVEELLDTLQQKGYLIALASSSSEKLIRRMLAETGLYKYFSFFISGNMFRESKPNPEIYEYAWSLTGFAKEECLLVEDSTYGIQAGRAAGLEVAAIRDYELGYDQSLANYLLEKITDLKNILEIN